MLGVFPHLVDRPSFEAIQLGCTAVVEATYLEERPQMLVNMTTGRTEPVYSADEFPRRRDWSRRYNVYYPSPSMHSFVARRVIQAVERSPELLDLLDASDLLEN